MEPEVARGEAHPLESTSLLALPLEEDPHLEEEKAVEAWIDESGDPWGPVALF